MKKLFAVAACSTALFVAVFAGCDLFGKPDDGKTDTPKITLTIKNQSSHVLSGVAFSGIAFATSGGDLAVSAEAREEVDNTKFGYITFTRKDIGISLRTADVVAIGDQNETFTFTNNTVVIEETNPNNKNTLAQISFLMDSLSAIELTSDTWKNGSVASKASQWFVFTATAIEQHILVDPGTLISLNIQVYDSNGRIVGIASDLYSPYANTRLVREPHWFPNKSCIFSG